MRPIDALDRELDLPLHVRRNVDPAHCVAVIGPHRHNLPLQGHPSLSWQFDFDGDAPFRPKLSHHPLGDFVAGVRRIPRHARILTLDLNPAATLHAHADHVVQRNGLVHSTQIVEPVGPQRADVEAEIDLGEGANANRHEGEIVSDLR